MPLNQNLADLFLLEWCYFWWPFVKSLVIRKHSRNNWHSIRRFRANIFSRGHKGLLLLVYWTEKSSLSWVEYSAAAFLSNPRGEGEKMPFFIIFKFRNLFCFLSPQYRSRRLTVRSQGRFFFVQSTDARVLHAVSFACDKHETNIMSLIFRRTSRNDVPY